MGAFEKAFKAEVIGLGHDMVVAERLWGELVEAYGDKGRYYHDLSHLEALYGELCVVREQLEDWVVVVFSVAYHDVVYDPLRGDNEERSAALAVERLGALGLGEPEKERVRGWVLATKTHLAGEDRALAYFIDADLSVLGAERGRYAGYAAAIRKEYGRVPSLLYGSGRRKVLRRFLERERLFQTEHFFGLYEARARENMRAELEGRLDKG